MAGEKIVRCLVVATSVSSDSEQVCDDDLGRFQRSTFDGTVQRRDGLGANGAVQHPPGSFAMWRIADGFSKQPSRVLVDGLHHNSGTLQDSALKHPRDPPQDQPKAVSSFSPQSAHG